MFSDQETVTCKDFHFTALQRERGISWVIQKWLVFLSLQWNKSLKIYSLTLPESENNMPHSTRKVPRHLRRRSQIFSSVLTNMTQSYTAAPQLPSTRDRLLEEMCHSCWQEHFSYHFNHKRSDSFWACSSSTGAKSRQTDRRRRWEKDKKTGGENQSAKKNLKSGSNSSLVKPDEIFPCYCGSQSWLIIHFCALSLLKFISVAATGNFPNQ